MGIFSVHSFSKKREHVKLGQTKNTCFLIMHICFNNAYLFQRAHIFHTFCSSLIFFQLNARIDSGRAIAKQNTDRNGQGEGERFKTGRNTLKTFIGDS